MRTLTFQYDAFGRRVEKQVTENSVTKTTSYVYDGEDILLRIDNDSSTTTTTYFIHGPGIDEPLAMIRSGQTYYYHADGLGSIVAITNSSQAIVQRYDYDTFGQLTASDDFANGYTFTGREWDEELGLYYYRARYYDAQTGRFISKDPIGFAGGDVNVYAYVQNSPINFIDPLGLMPPRFIPPGVNMQKNIAEAENMSAIDFANAVKSGGKWDYKRQGRQYEDFGNYNYGVTGRAVGFGAGTLGRAAGAYQVYSGTSRPEWGWPWGVSPYGDDPNDQVWINEGINDFNNGYYDMMICH